ncbi:hypothetical protein [Segnochrobactrum spirostomi]|uniref:Uncharacterized protein n=1 Tax=Segnochrobactrum spirostomi TaxID=2608987 RepID=A0A6A7Y191_9HYPH|nr:hypothetical protein [Segnochrobactrum spirostomi]MQT12683.1 hypothetical protein [Segnochrobactrum spirostomi]
MTTFTTIEDRALHTISGGTGSSQQTVQQALANLPFANEMGGATADIYYPSQQQLQQSGMLQGLANQ